MGNNSKFNNYNSNKNFSSENGTRKPYNNPPRNNPPPDEAASPLPSNYVDAAKKAIETISQNKRTITTSKIRNLLSMISDIYNVENLRADATLRPDSQAALTMMRIRIVYEAGREDAIKSFVKEAQLLKYMKDIGTSRQKLIDFSHYMEALVAYHRYLIGGKEG